MNRKVLINQLELAYSPLCNFDFNQLKSEPIVQDILSHSSLYIITQRPVISFENIELLDKDKDKAIRFEICQQSNPNILKVKLPIFQKNLATNRNKKILLNMGSNDDDNDFTKVPYMNIHGIKFYEEKNFLMWFTPEKFLQNYWKGYFEAEVKGNIREFTSYKVHYIGKATKQDIWTRLTGHSTLQEILSIEYPLNYGQLPTHEIAILFFKFKDNIQMYTWDGDDTYLDDIVTTLKGTNLPEQNTIFLDAEKALIKAMQPKYNKRTYKKYPKSEDGLFKHNYDSFSYSFVDPIKLIYPESEIEGGLNFMGGDTIIIKDNKIIELIKEK